MYALVHSTNVVGYLIGVLICARPYAILGYSQPAPPGDGEQARKDAGRGARYNAYSRSNRIPVFVVVGVGGSPKNPETMFCIPLNDAKYPEIFPSVFEKYERDPGKTFFWRDGMLK